MLRRRSTTRSYSAEEKLTKIIDVRKQLTELGLDKCSSAMNDFKDICNAYIKKNEEFVGSIPMVGFQRIMQVQFPEDRRRQIVVKLEFCKAV